ncbi:MAG TPA: MIP/aquaporin family protein [Ktedonobacterales bacterium]|jgi:glycerol uptake facilitator protein|nr:MIP/aquaporin family protein [Ktedonobacterales bacterium]
MSVAEEAHPLPGGQEEAGQPTSRERGVTMGQRFAGETLGTALLVFFHAGTAASDRLLRHDAGVPKTVEDVAFLALADGLSLFVIIMIVGKVSGVLINPAVTLGLASVRRFPWKDVPAYLAAQVIGAVIGAAAVLLVFGQLAAEVGRVGAVRLSPGTNIWQGLLIEGLGAFVLVLAISATAEDPRSPGGWAGFAIGMALAAAVFLIEPATGAAVNPARAFGPDLVYALAGGAVDWVAYLVTYLAGPILGAVAAATLYRALAKQPDGKPAPPRTGAEPRGEN